MSERKQILAIDKRDGKEVMIWEDRFNPERWDLPGEKKAVKKETKKIAKKVEKKKALPKSGLEKKASKK